MGGPSSKSKPPISLTPTVLLSAGHEWGYTLGFFLLFAAVAFFFVKLANGDFADWTLSMWRTRASSKRDDDDDAYARPLLSDDMYDHHEVVEL